MAQAAAAVRGERRAASVAVASVVVPAHDEASVIARCLVALLGDARPGEFEVVVVANGCSDDTAARARTTARCLDRDVAVLDVGAASKALALRAGDAHAQVYPRVYVDADVVCTTQVLRDLVRAVEQPGVELAVPQRALDLTAATYGARLYYDTWARSPRVQDMLAGRGCYALSAAGRARVGEFPERVADDRLITTSVPRSSTRVVDGAVRIFPPRDLASALAVRTRIFAGNRQLGPVEHAEPARGVGRSTVPYMSPRTWPGVLVYAAVTALAKLRARRAAGRGAVTWGRDDARGGA